MSSDWIFMKETAYTIPLPRQVTLAEKLGIPRSRWLGMRKHSDIAAVKKKMRAGDTLHVPALHCLGRDLQKIDKTLTVMHQDRISVIVHDCGYKDLFDENGMQHDYDSVHAFLNAYMAPLANSKRSSAIPKTGVGVGLARKNLLDYPAGLQDIVKKYVRCHKPGAAEQYTVDDALLDLDAIYCPVSRAKFFDLVAEYRACGDQA